MVQAVITGIGVISPIGLGREAFWEGFTGIRSGFKKVTSFNTDSLNTDVAGLVEGFDPARYVPPRIYRRMSKISRMAVAASIEAIEDSSINMEAIDKEKTAVLMGTAYGGSSYVDDFYTGILKEGPAGAHPFLFPETVPNAPASHIAIMHGITGPNCTFCQNEISAENAILYAKNLIERGMAEVVLVGGGDEISPAQYTCYDAVGALKKLRVGQEDDIRPGLGGGLVLGEGACVLVMEGEDHAAHRSAKIYGKLKSCVITGDVAEIGHYDLNGAQLARAISLAAEEAGVELSQIDQIDVSANFSGELDSMEHDQLSKIFSKPVPRLRVVPLKYLIGDFGGAGALRAAGVLLSLHNQISLPSVDIGTLQGRSGISPKWHPSENRDLSLALMTSSTFGGGSTAMIFERHR